MTIFCKLFDKSQTKKELCGRTFVALSCGFQTWEKFRFLTTLSTVTTRVISRQGAIGMLCLVTYGGVEGEGGVQLWEPWAPQGAPEWLVGPSSWGGRTLCKPAAAGPSSSAGGKVTCPPRWAPGVRRSCHIATNNSNTVI